MSANYVCGMNQLIDCTEEPKILTRQVGLLVEAQVGKYFSSSVRVHIVDSCYLEFQGTLWNTVPRNIRVAKVRKTINWTTLFNKWIFNLTPEVRDILKIWRKRGEIAPQEQFLLLSTIFCYLFLDFHVKTGTRFSLWDKWLFEISGVEITTINCTFKHVLPAKIQISLYINTVWSEI